MRSQREQDEGDEAFHGGHLNSGRGGSAGTAFRTMEDDVKLIGIVLIVVGVIALAVGGSAIQSAKRPWISGRSRLRRSRRRTSRCRRSLASRRSQGASRWWSSGRKHRRLARVRASGRTPRRTSPLRSGPRFSARMPGSMTLRSPTTTTAMRSAAMYFAGDALHVGGGDRLDRWPRSSRSSRRAAE